LRIFEIKAFHHANVYSPGKVVKMIVDLEKWADVPTKEVIGFNEALLSMLPGLNEHRCSTERPGGFAERLFTGTYPAHVIEHVCLELLYLSGYDVRFGLARQYEDTTRYTIVYSYIDETAGLEAGKAAVNIVGSLLIGKELDVDNILKEIKYKSEVNSLGLSTRAIVSEAHRRGIPTYRIGNDSIVQLGYGKFQKRIEATILESTSCISVDIAGDKSITKEILKSAGIPVPQGSVCSELGEALEISQMLGYPVVIKPERGNQGRGVSVAMMTPEEVIAAFEIARNFDSNVIVEKYIRGKDYRILVVGGQVVAAAQRIPAYVKGDGKSNISELITIINQDERRGQGHEKPLTKINIDDITLVLLGKRGYSPESVPPAGLKVPLKYSANLSTGGEAFDCTDKIHPLNIELSQRVVKAIDLDIAGIDICCPNISLPIENGNGAVVEVNAAPGIRMHLYPSRGKSRNVAKNIVDMLFPEDSQYSVPIISITGTNGKTTTTRMVAHIFRQTGLNVGMATTGGVFVNDLCIMKGDTTGPISARMILSDRTIDLAVLETARGGIIRSGLGYEMSDVGVITNISNDHLGIDGVYTLQDLLHVKSLVVETVKRNGYAILNADDSIVIQSSNRVNCNIVYFSRHANNIIIQKHISSGGKAVYTEDDHIVFNSKNGRILSLHIDMIPSTLKGLLTHNVENALAAASCAYAMNMPVKDIESGLKSFYLNEYQNPGRFNIFDFGDFKVIVDYAHNIKSYEMMAKALKKMNARKLIGIIGLAGDRSDEVALEIGSIAGNLFDEIIIKEDVDLRGRRRGEVAALLKQGVLSTGFCKESVRIIFDEADALNESIKKAKTGDLIVVFYERFEKVFDVVEHQIADKGKGVLSC